MKVKLLSLWLGPLPSWWGLYVQQMQRFVTVDWDCIVPPGKGFVEQTKWLNQLATERLGFPCRKGERIPDRWDEWNAACDYRPAYGELFQDLYRGYDWWGWVDLDVMFGDVDGLLPPLLTEDVCAVNFKEEYLSGCLALFRNDPIVTRLYRESPNHKEILGEQRYHCWDESGGYIKERPDCFWQLVKDSGLRYHQAPELYAYDSPRERHRVELRGGKLYDAEGQEKLFFHFMSDQWPVKEDGSSRYGRLK